MWSKSVGVKLLFKTHLTIWIQRKNTSVIVIENSHVPKKYSREYRICQQNVSGTEYLDSPKKIWGKIPSSNGIDVQTESIYIILSE